MQWVWTWGGQCFGYRDGDHLWTHDGRHVGRFDGDQVYGRGDGSYLGVVMSNDRLITNTSKKSWRRGGLGRMQISRVTFDISIMWATRCMLGMRTSRAPRC